MESPTSTKRTERGPWTLRSPIKVKKFCTEKLKLHCRKMSLRMYQMGYLIQRSGAEKGKDPLERQEGRLVSGIASLRHSFGLKREGGGATSLVGETKPEVMLVISATSTSTRERRRTTVLVGENNKESSEESAYRQEVDRYLPIDKKLRHRGCHHAKIAALNGNRQRGNGSLCQSSAGRLGTRLVSASVS